MRSRGFSLLEILVVLGIFVLLLGIGMVNYRGGARKASPQSLATIVVGELQAARTRAIQGHTFVALEFPSNGQGSCQSFSRWEGLSKARYIRGRNFSSEFSGSSIFIGHWPLSSGSFTTNREANGLEVPGFSLNSLMNPLPTSYLLVFTPTGSVLSNDWPMLDGRYQIVIGASLSATAASAPPGTPTVSPRPPYFSLQGLSQPQRIEIDTTGGVSLKNDLAASTGVNLQANNVGTQAAPVASTPPTTTQQTPVVQKIELSPGSPNLPPGVEGVVSKEDYLRLTVEATAADGDPLSCQWISPNGGAFTSSAPTRMRWDSAKSRWTSTWTFRADPNDPPLTHYDIECRVTDPHNTLATAAAGVTLTQTLEVRLKPFFAASEWPLHGLYTCDVDGSNLQHVPTPGMQPSFVSVHPDGNTIAFCDTDYANSQFHIWSINKDGSNLRRLTSATTLAACGAFSPDGAQYAFARGAAYYIMPACGEVDPTPAAAAKLPPQRVTMPPGVTPSWLRPSWHPTSKKLLFTGRLNAGADEALFVSNLETHVTTQISPAISRSLVPNATMWQAVYSRDPANPNLIFGVRYVAPWRMFKMQDDGTGFTEVADPLNSGYQESPALSRDNSGILYVGGPGAIYCDFNIATGVASNPQVISTLNSMKEIFTW